jgi:hypothetical protein
MKYKLVNKGIVMVILLLLITSGMIPIISGLTDKSKYVENLNHNYSDFNYKVSNVYESVLDGYYIYNLTCALSKIIFTEYNESNGEIAKGRAFGTKGEHKAAKILLENMTKLGLYSTLERLGSEKTWHPTVKTQIRKIEILDYNLVIHNGSNSLPIDCAPHYSIFGPRFRPLKITHNFTFKGLKVRHNHPEPFVKVDNYVLLIPTEDPRDNETPPTNINPLISYDKLGFVDDVKIFFKKFFDLYRYPNYKGAIVYDINDDEHNMWHSESNVPKLGVNGTIGAMINDSINNITVDFYVNQRINKSVESYNVIGQINGTDPSKIVIVDSLYDSWWCQGTGDAAIGMSIVMGIAKYFVEHNIKPRYTIKFIGFGGEEYGYRGAWYYEIVHRPEDILYVIDLNQLGFSQEEEIEMTLEIAANKESHRINLWRIVNRTDYENMVNLSEIELQLKPYGHLSNDAVFATKRPNCKTVCFLKNGPWLLHHRDGHEHTIGDVIDFYDWDDVNATGEIILNVTKYLAVGPGDIFTDCQFSTVDSDGDGNDDSIQASFNMTTEAPEDWPTIKGYLYKNRPWDPLIPLDKKETKFIIYKINNTFGTLTCNIPSNLMFGQYYMKLVLEDSTGEIADEKISQLFYLK